MTLLLLLVLLFSSTTILSLLPLTHSLGSSATLAATSSAVCGLSTSTISPTIQCYHPSTQQLVHLLPYTSFTSLSAGSTTLCALRDGGATFLCWDNVNSNFSQTTILSKRIYYNTTDPLKPLSLSLGRNHICAISSNTSSIKCWRFSDSKYVPNGSDKFVSISSGYGFSCGVMENSSKIQCWGSDKNSISIESEFRKFNMSSIVAGGFHVCGINTTGYVVCRGSNILGQCDVPFNSPGMYSLLSLGESHSCAIRRVNGTVVCWGSFTQDARIEGVFFEVIVSGANFTCGLVSSNFSVMCWGRGWTGADLVLPLSGMIPGSCVKSSQSCSCGVYIDSQRLCYDSGVICKPCESSIPGFVPSPPSLPAPPLLFPQPPPSNSSQSSDSKGLRGGLLAFAILGSIGVVSGLCSFVYCLWSGAIFGHKKIHNSVQPTITRGNSMNGGNSNSGPLSRSSTLMRHSSRAIRRQRSGTSKQADRAEEFSLAELAAATNNFSTENKLGAGSFGVVYRAKLPDGREVAIKRGDTGLKTKKFQEKESAFDSELVFLSRVHHKHLVRLVGFCEENDEKLLVYEYMKNGALHDHLHGKDNVDKGSSILNSWKIRIKIALDAARGIDYLHNYAVPPIIHRDIKSSNILLDENWTAGVSDFGLSLMGNPELDPEYRSLKAVGTVGYIDPEYYGLNVLTTKSDVYGLGVVLLELLTGKRAIFKDEENGTTPVSLVDFAVPAIMAGELVKVLDPRVGPPELNESEAVELVAYTAMHCVNLEGKDRPTMNDVVANLERALSLCDDSYGSISSGAISDDFTPPN